MLVVTLLPRKLPSSLSLFHCFIYRYETTKGFISLALADEINNNNNNNTITISTAKDQGKKAYRFGGEGHFHYVPFSFATKENISRQGISTKNKWWRYFPSTTTTATTTTNI